MQCNVFGILDVILDGHMVSFLLFLLFLIFYSVNLYLCLCMSGCLEISVFLCNSNHFVLVPIAKA